MSNCGKVSLTSLAHGYELLVSSAFVGMRAGLISGAAGGLFLAHFGVLYGIITGVSAGVSAGFCAAVLAVAIGGRHSCARFGAFFGALAAGTILVTVAPGSDDFSPEVLAANWPVLVVFVAAAAFLGWLVGTHADPRLQPIQGYTGMYRTLAVKLDHSDFYKFPLTLRLGLAFAITAPMCTAVPALLHATHNLRHPLG